MASQKVRPAALRRFFRTSTYLMYAFAPEKTPSLAGRNFCLAIPRVFAKPSTIGKEEKTMSEFTQVTVVKKANVYFDGRVTSRTIRFADGSEKTLGIMLPGEYTFNTGAREIMEIQSGELDFLLADTTAWRTALGGEAFEVPAKSHFTVRVKSVTDYCCSFLK
jgi:hypothetical protein